MLGDPGSVHGKGFPGAHGGRSELWAGHGDSGDGRSRDGGGPGSSCSSGSGAINPLYDTDILLWSEQQAAALKRRAESANDPFLDWENIAEEIESVGRSELHAVESHMVMALVHVLKSRAWPEAKDVPYWKAEAVGRRQRAVRSFTPSMRRRIDLAELYADARHALPRSYGGNPPSPVPETCPLSLEELLSRLSFLASKAYSAETLKGEDRTRAYCASGDAAPYSYLSRALIGVPDGEGAAERGDVRLRFNLGDGVGWVGACHTDQDQ